MQQEAAGEGTKRFRKLIESFNATTSQDSACRIQLFTLGAHLILKVVGTASKTGYNEVAQQALDIIKQNKTKSLVVDLTLCEQLNSSPLGMIGLLVTTFHQRGGTVHVVTKSEVILRSLRILGLDKFAVILDDIDDVVK